MRRIDAEILKKYDLQLPTIPEERLPKQAYKNLVSALIRGGWRYYTWLGTLAALILMGSVIYAFQWQKGLIITGMRTPFCWGLYIGNFVFLVGVAAAAVIVIIPAYLFHYQPFKNICITAELLAASMIIICLLFVTIDLGRPDRLWHLIPGLGQFHFPQSLMAWDCLVLPGYLILCLSISGYLLFCTYTRRMVNDLFLKPLVYLSIVWAISIHTVTALIYGTLSSLNSWHQAILVPRFLASASVVGPALLIGILHLVRKYTHLSIEEIVFERLAQIITLALFFNLFMVGAELVIDFYGQTSHFIHKQYLFQGIGPFSAYVIPTWACLIIQLAAFFLLLFPKVRRQPILLTGCWISAFISVWFEKGIVLLVSGFVPSATGEVFEYWPTLPEVIITLAVWALGFFIFTLLLRVAISIQTGVHHHVCPKPKENPITSPSPEPNLISRK